VAPPSYLKALLSSAVQTTVCIQTTICILSYTAVITFAITSHSSHPLSSESTYHSNFSKYSTKRLFKVYKSKTQVSFPFASEVYNHMVLQKFYYYYYYYHIFLHLPDSNDGISSSLPQPTLKLRIAKLSPQSFIQMHVLSLLPHASTAFIKQYHLRSSTTSSNICTKCCMQHCLFVCLGFNGTFSTKGYIAP